MNSIQVKVGKTVFFKQISKFSFSVHILLSVLQTGQTALHLAVRHGRVVMVRLLLSYGADANIQDSQGTTALMFASERGHTHIARLLLERSQCDLTLTDKVRLQKTKIHGLQYYPPTLCPKHNKNFCLTITSV